MFTNNLVNGSLHTYDLLSKFNVVCYQSKDHGFTGNPNLWAMQSCDLLFVIHHIALFTLKFA